ncbi:immunity 49 family protein [Streptomyces sp. CG1]|uniref:immunity 49 family protein n=1 Tax=Streptomyces sp. CG1 TaxID=1287523 RepID=UPI0034E25CF9
MTIMDVTRHGVDEQRIDDALQRGLRRAIGHWSDMRHNWQPLREGLREMRGDLLDLAAARTLEDPALDNPQSRRVLLTAAECALGELALGCFPDGDWDVPLPLVDETLTSDELIYEEDREPASLSTTAQTWVEAFAPCVISGLVWQRSRVIGPLLREDYAPAIRDGVPYSKRESVSTPADLAEMDALCGYLTVVHGPVPGAVPGPVPLEKPGPEARARAAGRLDAAGTISPDQRLLRILLDDDQPAFEQALAARLLKHRESVGADPAPRTLLPVRAIAVAALASQAHGWQLNVQSPYLPDSLLHTPPPQH